MFRTLAYYVVPGWLLLEAGPSVVAVLPFSSTGNGEGTLLFADGIHDDLLIQLSRLGSLRVISRTSVLGYRDASRNIRQIGTELGAAGVKAD